MGATTTRRGLDYPLAADSADVPYWMNRLAVDLDNDATIDKGAHAARPANNAAHNALFFETDTGVTFYDDGATWQPVGKRSAGDIATAELANSAVTSAKIADGAVTAAKVADFAAAPIDADSTGATTSGGAGLAWCSYDAVVSGYGRVRFWKYGQTVFITGIAQQIGPTGTSYVYPAKVLTLPAGYRPSKIEEFFLAHNDGTDNSIVRCTVATDGTVKIDLTFIGTNAKNVNSILWFGSTFFSTA